MRFPLQSRIAVLLALACLLLPACGKEGGAKKPKRYGHLAKGSRRQKRKKKKKSKRINRPAGEDSAKGGGDDFLRDRAPKPAAGPDWRDARDGKTQAEKYPERWYVRLREDAPVGYLHVRWTHARHRGRPVVRDETVSAHWHHRRIGHMNAVFESRSRLYALRTEAGELIETASETDQGSGDEARTVYSRVRGKGDGYEYTAWITQKGGLLADKTRRFHRVGETVHLDAESFLVPHIRRGGWPKSEPLRFHLLSGESGALHVMEAIYRGKERRTVGGRDEELCLVEVRDPALGTRRWEYYRPDGLLVRYVAGDTEIEARSEAQVKAVKKDLEEGAVGLGSRVRDAGLYTHPHLPAVFSSRSLVVEAVVKTRPGFPPPPFSDSPFQKVLERGKPRDGAARFVLDLRAFDKKVTATLPIDPKGFERHLRGTALMQVDAPSVRAAVREALGDEKDARRAAQRIASYVFSRLSASEGTIGEYSAVEILKHGFGDCSEHARLFLTMCRAAGIPARPVSGYCCLGRVWGNHAICEIWVGDWIGADPTTNSIGTRGRYVFFGYPDEPGSKAGVVSGSFTGYASLKLLRGSFGDGDPVDLSGREACCGVAEDGTAYSWLAGVACKKARPQWQMSANAAGLTVRSDRLLANLSVQPDQGRCRFGLLGPWGASSDQVTIQGYPARMSGGPPGSFAWFTISSRRRLMRLTVRLTGCNRAERKALWDDFFKALDIDAWKGRPVKAGSDYPPFAAKEDSPSQD